MKKVKCIAKEDLVRHEWMHEEVCISKDEAFEATLFEGNVYVTVEGYGFKDGVEFIPLDKVEIISS